MRLVGGRPSGVHGSFHGLQRLKPRSGAALDGGGDQPLDVEAIADQFEDPQLLLGRLAVGGDQIAGDRIGGLPQLCRERGLDRLQASLRARSPGRSARCNHSAPAAARADRSRGTPAGRSTMSPMMRSSASGMIAVGRRHDHHRVDQRAVVVEHAGSSSVGLAHRPKARTAVKPYPPPAPKIGLSPRPLPPSGKRATATPSGKAPSSRDGRARSSITNTPRSSARRISRP